MEGSVKRNVIFKIVKMVYEIEGVTESTKAFFS